MSFSTLAPLLAPPCIGAFIGYFTNKIAIRMLFRPLAPWHVFGLRVPFTPGVIPAKRHALARSIGEMVGRRLLTVEELGRAIAGAAFQERLRGMIARQVDAFCEREWPPPATLFPAEDGGASLALRNAAQTALYGLFEAWLDSPDAGKQATLWLNYARANADAVGFRHLARRLAAAFPSGGEAFGALFAAMFRQAAVEGKRLRDLLPERMLRELRGQVAAQAPIILKHIGEQLLSRETRPELLAALVVLARQLLDSLGPVGAIAGGFFEADTFEKKIDEYLDRHADELAARLESPALRDRLTAALHAGLDGLLDRSLAELQASLQPGEAAELFAALGKETARVLASETAQSRLTDALTGTLTRLLRITPDDGAMQKNAEALLGLLRSGQGRAFARALAGTVTRECFERSPGRAASRIPPPSRALLAERLAAPVNRLLAQELEGLVQALDIRDLIRDKVDSLDIVQLERLLLEIMAEQFKYINLFGAFLGFLIGLANLLFPLLR